MGNCTTKLPKEEEEDVKLKEKEERKEKIITMKPSLTQQPTLRLCSEIYGEEYAQMLFNGYKQTHQDDKVDEILKFLHDDYIGQGELFQTPFGTRQVIYCDWTASGKSLKSIENFISSEVQTLYANTHTTTSITGIQTSHFRVEARQIILKSVGGNLEKDIILFCGSGTTSSIYKLCRALMMSSDFDISLSVVFIGIYEHNSNILIWKENGFKIIVISEDKKTGGINKEELKQQLIKHKNYKLKIGSFSAASNVSGIIENDNEVTKLLHQHNALSFWDYACGGPYLNINLTNNDDDIYSKDAIFISPHKFIGGPQTPGLLCCKKKLLINNKKPVIPGGGSVFYLYGIENHQYQYLDNNIEEKEEAGTQDIIGSIRCALVFTMKNMLPPNVIEKIEFQYIGGFFKVFENIPNIHFIGNTSCKRLSIVAFNISYTNKNGKKMFLHHNYISALFNDLFGIQGRSGCACAGMYGAMELDVVNIAQHYVKELHNSNELMRPGYYRINFHYTLTLKEYEYIIACVKWICLHGYKFLPLYEAKVNTGEFIHYKMMNYSQLTKNINLRTLFDVKFDNGNLSYPVKHESNDNLYKQHLKLAKQILSELKQEIVKKVELYGLSGQADVNKGDSYRFYWLPCEIYNDVLFDL